MADPILVGIYVAAPISQVVFMLLAVYDALAITRMVGTFWAWTPMITAFVLCGPRLHQSGVGPNLTGGGTGFEDRSVHHDVLLAGYDLDELPHGTLAASTYGLRKIFRKTPVKRPARAVARSP
jgi:hypothetical protein